MLFDLRGRGRRRTIQVIYLSLAIVMGGGLILFGVGTGVGGGGLLDAFKGGGSDKESNSFVSQQEKKAARATQANPTDPAAWAALARARFQSAGQGKNYDQVQQTYTDAGKNELKLTGQAWQRYVQLTKRPDPDLALLVAQAYDATGDYASEAKTWEVVTSAHPDQAAYFKSLAEAAYRAKQTRKGDLAAAKALSLTPKDQRAALKQELDAAKKESATPARSTPTAAK